jgi:hypothetical protein
MLERKGEGNGLHPESMRQAGLWGAWSDDEVDDVLVEMTSYIGVAMVREANWGPRRTIEQTKSILLIGMIGVRIRCGMKAMRHSDGSGYFLIGPISCLNGGQGVSSAVIERLMTVDLGCSCMWTQLRDWGVG